MKNRFSAFGVGLKVLWLGSPADWNGMADRISRFLRSGSGMRGGHEAKGSRRSAQGKGHGAESIGQRAEGKRHMAKYKGQWVGGVRLETSQSVSGLSANERTCSPIGAFHFRSSLTASLPARWAYSPEGGPGFQG